MPTFELLGRGANGRVDMLKLSALRREDAIAEANKVGFKVTQVREVGEVDKPAKDIPIRQLEALELIANSKLVRRPVWTICWGICLASLLIGLVYWVATAPARWAAAERLEKLQQYERDSARDRFDQGMSELRMLNGG